MRTAVLWMRATCLRYTRSKARTSPRAAAATSDASSPTASLSELPLPERSSDPASETVPRGRPMREHRIGRNPEWLHRANRVDHLVRLESSSNVIVPTQAETIDHRG